MATVWEPDAGDPEYIEPIEGDTYTQEIPVNAKTVWPDAGGDTCPAGSGAWGVKFEHRDFKRDRIYQLLVEYAYANQQIATIYDGKIMLKTKCYDIQTMATAPWPDGWSKYYNPLSGTIWFLKSGWDQTMLWGDSRTPSGWWVPDPWGAVRLDNYPSLVISTTGQVDFFGYPSKENITLDVAGGDMETMGHVIMLQNPYNSGYILIRKAAWEIHPECQVVTWKQNQAYAFLGVRRYPNIPYIPLVASTGALLGGLLIAGSITNQAAAASIALASARRRFKKDGYAPTA